jgi:glucose dehydrogenase
VAVPGGRRRQRAAASYTVGGKQYVVVGAGGNTQIDFKRGDAIIAFTTD